MSKFQENDRVVVNNVDWKPQYGDYDVGRVGAVTKVFLPEEQGDSGGQFLYEVEFARQWSAIFAESELRLAKGETA